MSRSLDLFIAADAAELLGAVATATGHEPHPLGDGTWRVDLGGGEVATLGRHEFADDGLAFSAYPFDCWVRVPDGSSLNDHAAAAGLRSLADHLRLAGMRLLTVVDLEHRSDADRGGAGSAPAASARAR